MYRYLPCEQAWRALAELLRDSATVVSVSHIATATS